jgi:hypothetical protein
MRRLVRDYSIHLRSVAALIRQTDECWHQDAWKSLSFLMARGARGCARRELNHSAPEAPLT